jgi:WD40 repeat protein
MASPAFAAAPPAILRDLYGDPLPPGAVARLGSVRWRKTQGMNDPVVSPDGRWLVTTMYFDTGEKGLHVWEVATGKLIRTLDPRVGRTRSALNAFAFMPDGRRLLSCDDDGLGLYLWDFPSGNLRWLARGPEIDLTALAVRGDGRLAAAGDSKGKVYLYDVRCWKCVDSFPGGGEVHSLAFATDGCLTVVERSESRRYFPVRRIDLLTRREVRRFEVGPLNNTEEQIHLSADGRHVAAVLEEGAYSWEVKTGARQRAGPVRHPMGPMGGFTREAPIHTLAFSFDGRKLAAFDSQYAWLCDVGNGRLVNRVRHGNLQWGFRTAIFSRDGRMLGLTDGDELIWQDLRTGRQVQQRPEIRFSPGAMTYSPDGRSVTIATRFNISCWDSGTGRRLARSPIAVEGGTGQGRALFTRDGNQLIEGNGQEVVITDLRSGKTRELPGHGDRIDALALSFDGRLLASADGKEVRLWDFPGGKERRRIDTSSFSRIARGLAFSCDGRKLALGENRARFHLLDVETGKLIDTLQSEGEKKLDGLSTFPDGQWAGAFNSDGNTLFTAHRDTLRIWDLKKRQRVLTEKTEPIRPNGRQIKLPAATWGDPPPTPAALMVSADGRFLARIDPWGTLCLYELASYQRLHRFVNATKPVSFAPSGWQIAAFNLEDYSILLWDIGTLFRSLPAPRPGAQTAATLWDDLAHRDAAVAHRSLWRLAVLPGMEEFLDRRLLLLPPDSLKRHLADLGSDDFATRQRAERAIAKIGAAASPALEAALAKTEDLEMRTRLERLLKPLDLDGTGALRLHRAVLALEARGTPAARKLLGRLAAGIPGARLTEQAKKAVARLDVRR